MQTLKYFHYILFIVVLTSIASINSAYAQTKPVQLKKVTIVHKASHVNTKYKDSITLVPMAELATQPVSYKNSKTTYAKVVKFTLKITNGSTGAIPDPIAYKGAKFVKFYVNGHLNNPKALFDESEDASDNDKLILHGESQTFYCDWLLSTKSQLERKYGKKFYVQFSYLNKLSPKLWVNLNTLAAKG